MYKFLISLIFFTSFVTPGLADEHDRGIICKNHGATVITKTEKDCKNINGEVLTNFLFVINFDSGSFDGKTLTISGNGQSNVIYFLDRPFVEAGHIGVVKFKKLWLDSADNLNSSSREATLSLITNGKEQNIIVSINNPSISDNSITFQVDRVDGILPTEFYAGGIFMESTIAGVCPGCLE